MMLYTFSELPNRKLVAHVKEVAAAKHIPLQFDFVPGFGDDAGAIKLNNTGVPVTTILVPLAPLTRTTASSTAPTSTAPSISSSPNPIPRRPHRRPAKILHSAVAVAAVRFAPPRAGAKLLSR